jgi:hypothetical protein
MSYHHLLSVLQKKKKRSASSIARALLPSECFSVEKDFFLNVITSFAMPGLKLRPCKDYAAKINSEICFISVLSLRNGNFLEKPSFYNLLTDVFAAMNSRWSHASACSGSTGKDSFL